MDIASSLLSGEKLIAATIGAAITALVFFIKEVKASRVQKYELHDSNFELAAKSLNLMIQTSSLSKKMLVQMEGLWEPTPDLVSLKDLIIELSDDIEKRFNDRNRTHASLYAQEKPASLRSLRATSKMLKASLLQDEILLRHATDWQTTMANKIAERASLLKSREALLAEKDRLTQSLADSPFDVPEAK
ncbi:hypothetical protein [Pseudomonas sp. fls2-241-TYG-175]|uniref:hypothetical protein n=1 Tax=Pseudomonas sp. fls2-241-TYG-175 TaxID=3040312 RepID=UPI0025536065|nr:hypothetical protein [Pseudomonas sp. fls2-241-TYG-175]